MVDRAGHSWWQRDEATFPPLPRTRESVAVLLVEVGDVGAAGFEDPQP
jgi:hypothetical protein